jgi:hypothetical protein
MPKISTEVREMYNIWKDIGFDHSDFSGMTGNWETDMDEFARQYRNQKKRIKQIDVDADEVT